MVSHPSDAELYSFFYAKPGARTESRSSLDKKLSPTDRRRIGAHVRLCQQCSSPATQERVQVGRNMTRLFFALAVHSELWGTGEKDWHEPSPKRRKKLLSNLGRI